MWNRAKHILLILLICCFSHGTTAQKHPPEPGTDTQKSHQQGPCGQGNGGGGGRIPPPVGLCLPINDYVIPLLILGIFYGAYKVRITGAVTSGRYREEENLN